MDQVKTHAESLGWAFLLAWVFCMFYSGSMDSLSDYADFKSQTMLQQFVVSVLPVSFAIIALVVAVALEPKCGSPAQSRKLRIGCPVLTALGTLLMLAPIQNPLAAAVLFVVASAATGMGSGIMWVMWGQQYARLNQEAVEVCAPVSGVLAALLSMVAMLLPDVPSNALVAVFPLVSGFSFCRAWAAPLAEAISDRTSAPAVPGPLGQAASNMGRAGFGILAACLFVSLEGSFWQAGDNAGFQTSVIFVLSAAFMLVVGSFATSGPRRVSLAYAYRWMCPLMMVGFAALVIAGGDTGAYFAAAVGIASRFAFCLITQMYFASVAARGAATPVQAYGMGWIFVHVGDFLGVTCVILFEYLIRIGCMSLASVAALCSVLMVAAMMFALGGERFLSWELPSNIALGGGSRVELSGRAVAGVGMLAVPAEESAGASQQIAAALERAGAEVEAASVAGASADAATGQARAAATGVGGGAADGVAGVNGGAGAGAAGAAAAAVDGPADGGAATEVAGAAASLAPAPAAPVADPLIPRVEELSERFKLTKREREVFALLAHGRSVPYIRDALIISKDTAATHTKHIYAKLGVHSRQELISMVEGED